jgi:hypothetical protein
MIFVIPDVVLGVLLLVIAYLIYRHSGGRGSRTIGVLVAILGLIGLYLILVRGLGLISLE